jgi:hypothetical protein
VEAISGFLNGSPSSSTELPGTAMPLQAAKECAGKHTAAITEMSDGVTFEIQ